MLIEYKEQGQTLGQLTNQIKNITNNKICYIGRLDPMASGLVCYFSGNECKLASKYLKFDKTYMFNLILGISTDSCDSLGMVTGLSPCFEINYNFLEKFNDYIYIQEYPIYSSFVIKKDGLKKPLWYYAINNIKIDNLPKHEVHIKNLELNGEEFYIKDTEYFIKQIKKLDDDKGISLRKKEIIEQYSMIEGIHLMGIPLIARVSSGTYIRKLCEDIGNYLRIPAMADSIERVAYHFPGEIENIENLENFQ